MEAHVVEPEDRFNACGVVAFDLPFREIKQHVHADARLKPPRVDVGVVVHPKLKPVRNNGLVQGDFHLQAQAPKHPGAVGRHLRLTGVRVGLLEPHHGDGGPIVELLVEGDLGLQAGSHTGRGEEEKAGFRHVSGQKYRLPRPR